MPWDYRSVEGALYGLGRPPDARPARAAIAVDRVERGPGPRFPTTGVDRRVDVSFAVRQELDDEDRRVITEHYVLGIRRHGYAARSRAVKRLAIALDRRLPSREHGG